VRENSKPNFRSEREKNIDALGEGGGGTRLGSNYMFSPTETRMFEKSLVTKEFHFSESLLASEEAQST
jgi:hypothetical protein